MGELVLTKEEIYCYVKKQYGTLPEHLWKKDPESAVLRHQNGKWYAVIMNVKKNVLGLQETGNVDIKKNGNPMFFIHMISWEITI